MSVDDLYQEIILDHYRSPRNRRVGGEGCSAQAHQDNPLCGDAIDVYLSLQDGQIRWVSFQGQGCAISQASASMMTEAVAGLSVEAALGLLETVRQMMHGQPPGRDLGDLAALEGVAQFPVRVKCALLAWTALREALRGGAAAEGNQGGGA